MTLISEGGPEFTPTEKTIPLAQKAGGNLPVQPATTVTSPKHLQAVAVRTSRPARTAPATPAQVNEQIRERLVTSLKAFGVAAPPGASNPELFHLLENARKVKPTLHESGPHPSGKKGGRGWGIGILLALCAGALWEGTAAAFRWKNPITAGRNSLEQDTRAMVTPRGVKGMLVPGLNEYEDHKADMTTAQSVGLSPSQLALTKVISSSQATGRTVNAMVDGLGLTIPGRAGMLPHKDGNGHPAEQARELMGPNGFNSGPASGRVLQMKALAVLAWLKGRTS